MDLATDSASEYDKDKKKIGFHFFTCVTGNILKKSNMAAVILVKWTYSHISACTYILNTHLHTHLYTHMFKRSQCTSKSKRLQWKSFLQFTENVSGILEVVMLAMMGHTVVLDTALGTLMVPGYRSLQMG